MENKRTNQAVSEIIGTVLILMIAVSIFSIVYIYVFSIPSTATPPAPYVNIIGRLDINNDTILEHHGGEALPLSTEVKLIIGETNETFMIGDDEFLSAEFKEDNTWSFGEYWVFPTEDNFGGDLTGLLIKAMVIDTECNSIIAICILQEGSTGG